MKRGRSTRTAPCGLLQPRTRYCRRRDPRVQQNPAYLTIVLLARVVIRLGSLNMINTKTIEGLFARDFSYLQEMYNRVNQNGSNAVKAVCPKCAHAFDVEVKPLGE